MSQPVSVETLLVGDVVGCSSGEGTRCIARVVRSVKPTWLPLEVLRCDGCGRPCNHVGTEVGCALPRSAMAGIYFWTVADYCERYGMPPWKSDAAKLAEARALLEAMRDRAHVCNGGGCKLGLSETLRWLAANPGTEGK